MTKKRHNHHSQEQIHCIVCGKWGTYKKNSDYPNFCEDHEPRRFE